MTIKELLTTRARMWELEPIDQVKRMALIILIVVASIWLFDTVMNWATGPMRANERKAASYEKLVSVESRANLGVMESNYVSGRRIERTDEVARSLRSFLETEVNKNPVTNCATNYYVAAANKDETQVLIRYTCDNIAHVPMFAMREGTTWHMVGWRMVSGRFDKLGVPECGYASDNAIDTAIAPVCGNWLDEQGNEVSSYTVR